jgi:ferredoxin
MYLILTSKPGQYRSEPGAGLQALEAYEYLDAGRLRARFVIAELEGDSRVRIVEESAGGTVNAVPTKFFPRFASLDAARGELRDLCRTGRADTQLRPVDLGPPQPAAATGTVHVTFLSNGGKVAAAPSNSNLLRISLREKGGIPFKCGGGLCGTCKCRIEHGREHTDEVKAKERRHLSEQQLQDGWRMACQTFVRGDIAVSW